MAITQIVVGDAELMNEGKYCGYAGECLTGGFTPAPYGDPMGIAIGHTVTFPVGPDLVSNTWIEGEFGHVLQYEAFGFVGVLFNYGVEITYRIVIEHKSQEDAYNDLFIERDAHSTQSNPNLEPGMSPWWGPWREEAG